VQLYLHIKMALDRVLGRVGTELVKYFRHIRDAFQSRLHSLTRSEHFARRTNSLRSPSVAGADASSRQRNSMRTAGSRAMYDSCHVGRSAAAAADRTSATQPQQFVYDTDTISSALRSGLQPVTEFLTERLLTMSFWLSSNDFRQVRNALCIHIAEVKYQSHCLSANVHFELATIGDSKRNF
jgi:hypothetical protein